MVVVAEKDASAAVEECACDIEAFFATEVGFVEGEGPFYEEVGVDGEVGFAVLGFEGVEGIAIGASGAPLAAKFIVVGFGYMLDLVGYAAEGGEGDDISDKDIFI